jgi:hypothetical protein
MEKGQHFLEPCSELDYNLLHDRYIIWLSKRKEEEWLICMSCYQCAVLEAELHVALYFQGLKTYFKVF